MHRQCVVLQESAHAEAQKKGKAKCQRMKPVNEKVEIPRVNEGMARKEIKIHALRLPKSRVPLALTSRVEGVALVKMRGVGLVILEARSGILEHMIEKTVAQHLREVAVIPESLEARDHKDRSNELVATHQVVKGQERCSCRANEAVMIPLSRCHFSSLLFFLMTLPASPSVAAFSTKKFIACVVQTFPKNVSFPCKAEET